MRVMNSEFVVENISTSAFSNASGKIMKFSSERLWYRTPGIMFYHFDFSIDPTEEDARIQSDPFCFQFSLQLPHQHFDASTNKVEDI